MHLGPTKLILFRLFPLVLITLMEARASDPHGAGSANAKATPSPEFAIRELKKGNDRFIHERPFHANQDLNRIRETKSAQHPFAIVLSCSDSRVPPEILFDQGIGQLFVIRVAGNVVGSAAVASIEYAVEHLGANLIVVMGHESCGAVKAAMAVSETETAGSPDLDTLLAGIRPSFSKLPSRVPASILMERDPKLVAPVTANVDFNADRLMTRSTLIRNRVLTKKLKIVRAIYGLDSGKVKFWGD